MNFLTSQMVIQCCFITMIRHKSFIIRNAYHPLLGSIGILNTHYLFSSHAHFFSKTTPKHFFCGLYLIHQSMNGAASSENYESNRLAFSGYFNARTAYIHRHFSGQQHSLNVLKISAKEEVNVKL